MKKMTCKLIITLFIIVQQSNAQEKFVLEGYVKGYEGKTKLIINKILPNHEADMVNEQVLYMIDGRFKLEGKVNEPTKYSIRIRPENLENVDPRTWEQAAFIWIENKNMFLTGEKGNFRYSHVTGSIIQDQHEESLNYVQFKLKENQRLKDSLISIKQPTKEIQEKLTQINLKNYPELDNEYRLEFSYNHPDYFVSVYNISWYVKWLPVMVPKAKAVEFFNKLNDSLQTTINGQQIKYYIDNITVSPKLNTQDKPYEFSLPDSLGNYISLISLKGKVILLDFWFSSCGACRMEHKNYLSIYQKYNDKGFEILSVSRDKDKNNWLKAMKTDQMIWKCVWDENSKVTTNMYLVTMFPTNYLINSKGIIIAKNIIGEALEAKLNEIFER
jgi:peroxiredoxin